MKKTIVSIAFLGSLTFAHAQSGTFMDYSPKRSIRQENETAALANKKAIPAYVACMKKFGKVDLGACVEEYRALELPVYMVVHMQRWALRQR